MEPHENTNENKVVHVHESTKEKQTVEISKNTIIIVLAVALVLVSLIAICSEMFDGHHRGGDDWGRGRGGEMMRR